MMPAPRIRFNRELAPPTALGGHSSGERTARSSPAVTFVLAAPLLVDEGEGGGVLIVSAEGHYDERGGVAVTPGLIIDPPRGRG